MVHSVTLFVLGKNCVFSMDAKNFPLAGCSMQFSSVAALVGEEKDRIWALKN